MDINLHEIYLSNLLEYFKKFGDGQLVFSATNLSTMELLKDKKYSICVLGYDLNLER